MDEDDLTISEKATAVSQHLYKNSTLDWKHQKYLYDIIGYPCECAGMGPNPKTGLIEPLTGPGYGQCQLHRGIDHNAKCVAQLRSEHPEQLFSN